MEAEEQPSSIGRDGRGGRSAGRMTRAKTLLPNRLFQVSRSKQRACAIQSDEVTSVVSRLGLFLFRCRPIREIVAAGVEAQGAKLKLDPQNYQN
jgi:hypothetical protein